MGLRGELLAVYRWLRRYGYNDSHSGNVSARKGKHFWVTPTGACADTLQKAELIRCRIHDGALPEGASLDAPLHQSVYAAIPEAGALLHSRLPCGCLDAWGCGLSAAGF